MVFAKPRPFVTATHCELISLVSHSTRLAANTKTMRSSPDGINRPVVSVCSKAVFH